MHSRFISTASWMTPTLHLQQTKLSLSPSSPINCLSEIKIWFTSNFLLLNSADAKFLLVGTKSKVSSSQLIALPSPIPPSLSLAAILSSSIVSIFDQEHYRSAYSPPHIFTNINRLCPSHTEHTSSLLIHRLITSQMDDCNSPLFDLLETPLAPGQIQNRIYNFSVTS